ncbi:hypothetical protein V6N11_075037 [Hibiscus sabdariffa]|uniref:Secreted protein n=1 Tax=Hibiscus sabdariffa TaxID=183260 RepID=A0ABR2R5N6_9ROSI
MQGTIAVVVACCCGYLQLPSLRACDIVNGLGLNYCVGHCLVKVWFGLDNRDPGSGHARSLAASVRFVVLERCKSDSTIKIQKVFRGFLVRKSLKKIMAIREQVNEMERGVRRQRQWL